EEVFAYLLDAVDLVAREGWRLLNDYDFDLTTGTWTHRDPVPTSRLSLDDIRDEGGEITLPQRRPPAPLSLQGALDEARRLLASHPGPATYGGPLPDPDAEALRWFPLPGPTGALPGSTATLMAAGSAPGSEAAAGG